jgi:hypothetical protein
VDSVPAAAPPAKVTEKLNTFVDVGARHYTVLPGCRRGRRPGDTVHRRLDDIVPAVREPASRAC